MTDEPTTSEQPSGHLRWVKRPLYRGRFDLVLQQLWYLTEYRGLEVSQAEAWRDVPFAAEE